MKKNRPLNWLDDETDDGEIGREASLRSILCAKQLASYQNISIATQHLR
jgi:hypothetical protein